jgi:hypothetical protein
MKVLLDLPVDVNQTLNIIKAKYNLKNKAETISVIVKYYTENELEPELRLDFIKKVLSDSKNDKPSDFKRFNSTKELDKYIRGK